MFTHTKVFLILQGILVFILVSAQLYCSCDNQTNPTEKKQQTNNYIVTDAFIKEVEIAIEKYLQELPPLEAGSMKAQFGPFLHTLKKLQKGEKIKALNMINAANKAVYLGKPEIIQLFINEINKNTNSDKNLLKILYYRLEYAKKIKTLNEVIPPLTKKQLAIAKANIIKELSNLADKDEFPYYDTTTQESIRKTKKETDQLIKQTQKLAQQAERKRKLKEEKNKKEAVKSRKAQEELDKIIKEAKEIEKKRGKFFIRDGEISDVKSIKRQISKIKKKLSNLSMNAPLPQNLSTQVDLIIKVINKKRRKLEAASKNIQYNINHPDERCRMDYDKEDLEIAKKLLEDLKNYKAEIRQLLEAHGEKLADYEVLDEPE
jgi:hypothetical protein